MKWPLSDVTRKQALPRYWLLAASLLIPLLLFALVAWQDRAAVLKDAEDEVADTADVLEANARDVFETQKLIARVIDGRLGWLSWEEIGASQSLHDFLTQFEAQYPQVLGVWLVDPSGRLRNSSRTFPVPVIDLSDRDYFLALRDKDVGTFISHVVMGRITAERNFNLVSRRSSTNGSFDGVIVVSVSPAYFTDFWRKIVPPLDTMAGLLKNDLNVLAREPSSQASSPSPDSAIASAIRQSDRGSLRTVSVVDGVDRLMAFRRVGAYDVYVVHGLGVNAALGLWYRHLALYGSFFALAAAALFLISTRVFAEGNRRRVAEAQLHQAEKMEAIGQLTGQFAHDFGNILTGILLNLELLRGRPVDANQLDDAVDHAIAAAEQGQKAVRAMLAFARREPLESEVIDVDATLGGIDIMVRQALESKSRLAIAIPPGTWPIQADRIQLELAILNLAVNARDAMPDGGTLRITASNVRANGEPNGLNGEFVALSVSDTGSGISRDIISKVFEPFFTTKEVGKGTGLGLSQVYSLATSCGGTATVDSTPARGTTVTLYLPKAPQAAPGTKEPGAPAFDTHEEHVERRGAILIVEDEERIRQVVAHVLRERGYSVIEADTGDEALATLPSHPEIVLIFTDIRMPGGRDGISMAAEARRLRPDLKILFATGYPGDALRGFVGATILRKPYRAHQVVEAVEKEMAA
jgi:two-component system, NtrC family, sensor kinase